MQKRPSLIYIRRRCCRRRNVRLLFTYMLALILLLCLGMRPVWALLWAAAAAFGAGRLLCIK